jgi:hypothetical protein
MTTRREWPELRRGLIAILRGVRPGEAPGIVEALIAEGLECAEIPLNSPDPFESIGLVAKAFGDQCLIGAGTVMSGADVARVDECGGQLIVSPNADAQVIRQACACGVVSMPGVFTASEAVLALEGWRLRSEVFPGFCPWRDGNCRDSRDLAPVDHRGRGRRRLGRVVSRFRESRCQSLRSRDEFLQAGRHGRGSSNPGARGDRGVRRGDGGHGGLGSTIPRDARSPQGNDNCDPSPSALDDYRRPEVRRRPEHGSHRTVL